MLNAATQCQPVHGSHVCVLSGHPVHVCTGQCKSAAGLGKFEFPCQNLECSLRNCLQVTLTFPAVLERLQLKAFDLCKLIETFVRHEPLLPRELKRHLFNIEEKMLEALAFERGSSLYPRLIIACSDDLTSECLPLASGVLYLHCPEKFVNDRKSGGKGSWRRR